MEPNTAVTKITFFTAAAAQILLARADGLGFGLGFS
jgi:hypothetical protein